MEIHAPHLEILKSPTILDGRDAKYLFESGVSFETPAGDRGVAATYNGTKGTNEDRIAVDAARGIFAVMDGMADARPAQIAAEEILNADIPTGARAARQRIANERVYEGTCLIGAELHADGSGKSVDIFQAGDSRLMIFSANGELRFRTHEQARGHSSRAPIQDSTRKNFSVTREEQILVCDTPTNIISLKGANLEHQHQLLTSGDRIVLASDGITNILTADEISEYVTNATPEDALARISQIIADRIFVADHTFAAAIEYFGGGLEAMQKAARTLYEPVFSPQKDHCSIVIVEVA